MTTETPILNDHNKAEYPPMHTVEHILNQTMVRMFGCERSRNAHIERKKSKCDYTLPCAPTEEQIAEICQGTPNDWALVNAEQMREIYTLLPVHSEITEISEQNHARMEEIVRQQALRGGYRLAKILNEIFSK